MISISIDGLATVKDRFKTLLPEVQDKTLRQLAQQVHDDIQDGADRHTQTGQLARSVFLRKTGPDTWETGHDAQQAPHARFVVWGTRPHEIKPNQRKALRWAADGKFFFAKTVRHPGYPGDHYLREAARNAPRHLAAIIDQLQPKL